MIAPITSIANILPPVSTSASEGAGSVGSASSGAGAAGATGDTTNAFGNALDALQSAQSSASSAEALSAAGQGNLADTMIAATQASLDTEVTTSLLNQATTAYNDIMNLSF